MRAAGPSPGSRVPVSLSRPRGRARSALTAYGDEPWTCSREYWRLYFGMECAELLSFNIRGLQKNPKHHRGHCAASPSLWHLPAPAQTTPSPTVCTARGARAPWGGCGPRGGHLRGAERAAQRHAASPHGQPLGWLCNPVEQKRKASGLGVLPRSPGSPPLWGCAARVPPGCPTDGFLVVSCGTSTAVALFCTRALQRDAPLTG